MLIDLPVGGGVAAGVEVGMGQRFSALSAETFEGFSSLSCFSPKFSFQLRAFHLQARLKQRFSFL